MKEITYAASSIHLNLPLMTETYTHFALKCINGERPDDDFRLLNRIAAMRLLNDWGVSKQNDG